MPWFMWLLVGAIGLWAFIKLRDRLSSNGGRCSWCVWLGVVGWYAMLVVGMDMVYLSIYENEKQAAFILAMIFTVICVGALPLLRRVFRANKSADV